MEAQDKRLKVLDDDEIAALYDRPLFDEQEREQFFTLTAAEQAVLSEFSLNSRVYFILQLGYFKARQQFYVLKADEAQEDLAYIRQHYFPALAQVEKPSKDTWTKQQRLILQLVGYRLCLATERQQLVTKAAALVKISSKPIYVFRELLQFLTVEQLVAPAYNTLRDIIGQALEQEKERLSHFAQEKLSPEVVSLLQDLLTKEAGFYKVTQLKRSPSGFGFEQMQREIARGEQIYTLYHAAKQLVPQLEISNEGIKYYASLVSYYSASRMRELDKYLVYIYLLCFVFHRYQRFQDNLITYFIHQVRQYIDDAKEAGRSAIAFHRLERNRNLLRAGQVLQLFTDDTISADTPFGDVRTRAFNLLERPKLKAVAEDIINDSQLDEAALRWQYLDGKAMEFKRRLRRVVRTVTFTLGSENDPLDAALEFLQKSFQTRKALWHFSTEEIPLQHIPEPMRRYFYTTDGKGQKQLQHDRYEFFIYRLLRNRLEAGDAFCRESIRFRSFEDDLLSDQQWRQKTILIADSNLPLLQQPIDQHLTLLEQEVEERLQMVNKRILAGQNDHIEVRKSGKNTRWSLAYPTTKLPINHSFFDALPLLDIAALMHLVNEQTEFLDSFEHILHRYAVRTADRRTLVAALIAWGTNLGLGRLGAISDISFDRLEHTSSSFIRLETLKAANDTIVNALAQQPIFQLYDIDGSIHSSSDGQKYETRLHTFNARHSPKYFGLHKGVVSYTLVANHVPLYARVIGANEHESHYVFDLLHNNSTDVQPTTHSTDTHGTNQVNFALLHLFGYQFAPRYKDIYQKVSTSLYGFHHPSHYDDTYLLKPIRKIQKPLIIGEWDNVQRIILSLALKATTQSVIVGKLSAYARRNRTKRALWEYDNIIRTLYLLDYVDSLSLRRNVTRALNRGEAYHQLRRAVSHANFGKLRFKSEQEQQIWNECSRLITNCVIYYNILLLSKLLELKRQQGDEAAVQALARISPIAWQHINFHGRYEFGRSVPDVDLDTLVQRLAKQSLVLEPSD